MFEQELKELKDIVESFERKVTALEHRLGNRSGAIEPSKTQFFKTYRHLRFGSTNKYAITACFNVDYRTQIVTVGVSICNGDNFERNIGRNKARVRATPNSPIRWALSDQNANQSLVNQLATHIGVKNVDLFDSWMNALRKCKCF